MEKKYFLSQGESHIGPYTEHEVLERLKAKESQWTDYVFEQAIGQWQLLIEHPIFMKHVPVAPVSAPSPQNLNPSLDKYKDKEWFILKDGNNYGPFSKIEIVQMLQQKKLHEFEYIWQSEMPAWKKLSDVEEFQPNQIQQMKESGLQDISEIFFRRRHARAQYGCSLIVHNNKRVFRGQSMELSAGGAGFWVEGSNFLPGEKLFLHFKPGDGVPPFNAICEVVNKHEMKNQPGEYRYGVRFVTISDHIIDNINQFTNGNTGLPKAA